jgi:hypothetical protein
MERSNGRLLQQTTSGTERQIMKKPRGRERLVHDDGGGDDTLINALFSSWLEQGLT